MVKTKFSTIAVPLAPEETKALDEHLMKTGLKKGAFVRKAILAYLNRQEQEAVRECP